MTSEPILNVRGLSKSFGSLKAVDAVSFTVAPGEILGIAGPNGAGKTTLFNLISRNPFGADRGDVVFSGSRIEKTTPHRIFALGLARTFQKETAFSELSVAQNVRLGGHFGSGSRGRELDRSIDAALERLELTSLRHERAGSLPVYESKRLMIASAVVTKPKLLMLDEPASGLNAVEQRDLKNLILGLQEDGMAIMLIEHILPLLFGVSQRVMVMNFGCKLVEGEPHEVAHNSQVIEAYLGSSGQAVALDT